MKKLLMLACALLSLSVVPAHAEETITPVKRPRQLRKKPPVEVVEDDEEVEEAPAPRERKLRKKPRVQRYEEEDEEYEEAARRRRRHAEPAYESAYDNGYGNASFRTSHWQVGMDLFGPAVAYSFGGSYLFGDHVALNVGVSGFSVSTSNSSGTLILLPVSVSGLFGGPDHHFEVTAGATPVFGSAKTTSNDGTLDRVTDSGAFFTGGIGYRYWPALGGFHFRATGYIIAGNSVITPWLGFQFGYAF